MLGRTGCWRSSTAIPGKWENW